MNLKSKLSFITVYLLFLCILIFYVFFGVYVREGLSRSKLFIFVVLLFLFFYVLLELFSGRAVRKEKEIEKMKDDFISIASHQLKTPLTAIKWYIEMMLRDKHLNEMQTQLLKESYAGAKRMARIVNDLLNISRLESGRIRIEPELIQPESFVADIISYAEPLLKQHFCKIKLKTFSKKLPKIPIDPSMLGQVIQNLVTNAILYTPKERRVPITVSVARRRGDCIISVKDNGIGIPKNVQGRIFEKFFRSDDAQMQDTTGSGLGLYIAKKIMEASGGNIWFESEEGRGSVFYVSIPVKGMKVKKGQKGLT